MKIASFTKPNGNPYLTIPLAQKILSVTHPSAKNAIQTLVDVGVIEELPKRSKIRIFRATEIEEVLNN